MATKGYEGQHRDDNSHQSGNDRQHRGKPEKLTSKYEGKHTGKGK